MINGCDVSYLQGKQIDFNKMKNAGVEFVYIKATDFNLKNGVDDCFYNNVIKAKTAGLLVGVYHRWQPDSKYGVNEQSALFYSVVGGICDLPPSIEVNEGGNPKALWTSRLYAIIRKAEKYFQRKPIIFTSNEIWKKNANNYQWAKNYPLWIVQYSIDQPNIPAPWERWTIWRYSKTEIGEKFGINKKEAKVINMDYFNGNITELRAL